MAGVSVEMEAGGSKRPDRTWGSVLGVRGIHLAWLTSVRATLRGAMGRRARVKGEKGLGSNFKK